MQFTDKINNPQFTITKVDGGDSITATIERNQVENNLVSPLNKGTLINAAFLNGKFNEKQNRIVAREGIIFENGKLAVDESCFAVGYADIAKDLSGGDYRVNKNTWTAEPIYTFSNYGIHYLCDVENDAVKYANADVSFDVEDVNFNVDTDVDPTIAIKFIDSSDDMNSLFCLFGFNQGRVRLIKHGEWTVLGAKTGVYYPTSNGELLPFKVGAKRYKNSNGVYVYEFYLNENKVGSISDTALTTDYNRIAIGTIGCKATVKHWKASGTY